jgi:polysaccharide deacetylase family protein (PEP-CTERM system associated)
MSVDVEDYYQVSAFAGTVERDAWASLPSRVEDNTRRCLDLFERHGARATFFTLGMVAERYPALMREIVRRGHELASHGYAHHRVTGQDPKTFLADITRTKKILEDAGGVAVNGYRAASFSIDGTNWWAYDCLAEAGYRYSSSLHPIVHDHYGMPDAPRFGFYPTDGAIVEFPVSTVEIGKRRFSCAGGGFFRLLPYAWSRWALNRLNRSEGKPGIFYFHPWEIDPGQPRMPNLPLKARLRHYTNLDVMEAKLSRLLSDFAWTRLDEALQAPVAARTV